MKIVHFSDWHGKFQKLPEADLYICTGDMYADPYGYRTRQTEAFQKTWQLNGRSYFGTPDAPLVCVKGNHDCVPLAPLFGGDAIELDSASSPKIIEGFKIGVLTGVRVFKHSTGWDLAQDQRMAERVAALSADIDILIAHVPAGGLLDDDGERGYGVPALRPWLIEAQPKLFCHGHVHEAACEPVYFGDTLISNAATRYNVIEIET
jgi:Icc-related predicted phosphoesterase